MWDIGQLPRQLEEIALEVRSQKLSICPNGFTTALFQYEWYFEVGCENEIIFHYEKLEVSDGKYYNDDGITKFHLFLRFHKANMRICCSQWFFFFLLWVRRSYKCLIVTAVISNFMNFCDRYLVNCCIQWCVCFLFLFVNLFRS